MIDTKLIETHITRNPGILKGKPIIRGTRIAVDLVVDWVESGVRVDQILEDYPNLTREDIEAAMAFAAWERSHTSVCTW